jgi:CheY-like chemotaxis protein
MVQALNPKNASVLIVEDNPDDSLLVARALQAFGIRHVYAVDTAEEALSFLETQPCDVALIDYNLPRMNGLTLLQRLATAYPHLRTIIVTGARDDKIAASVLKGGAADYVCKDEMLTSGIMRSLQQALREEFTESDLRQQALVEAGSGGTSVAREEAEWLLRSLEGRDEQDGAPAEWLELIQAFGRVITETMRSFPEPAARAEDALVRMIVSRGASPTEILRLYVATLRTLSVGEQPPRISPLLTLVRVYAQVLAQYQIDRSMEAARRAA